MNRLKHPIAAMVLLLGTVLTISVWAGTNETIINGLKEALNIGIENAVTHVSALDGYYKNPTIKIPLPPKLKSLDQTARKFGGQEVSEALIEKMNRAAEKAAPQAKSIFLNAVKEISFDDAMKILNGKKSEATDYLQNKTTTNLEKAFYPIVKQSMEEVDAIKTYNQYVDKYAGKLVSNPFLKSAGVKLDLDITAYVTGKATEGLFKMVAAEETKIRKDPEARVTDLLKDVFGGMFQ